MAKSGAARYFQSVTNGSPPFIARCFLAGLGVPLHTLMLITITKRKYLANGYSVVKEQPIHHKTDKGQRVFVSLCPNPHLHGIISPSFEKKFKFFYCRINRPLDRHNSTPLHSCNLLIGQSLKVIQYEPPSLYFGQFRDCSM